MGDNCFEIFFGFVCRENLKENARLVLEENQNLLEQIEVKDEKAHDMHQAHMQEGTMYFDIRSFNNISQIPCWNWCWKFVQTFYKGERSFNYIHVLIFCFCLVSKLNKQLVLLKAEKADMDQDLEEIKKRYKELKTKYDAMILDNQSQQSSESYINTIAELKK